MASSSSSSSSSSNSSSPRRAVDTTPLLSSPSRANGTPSSNGLRGAARFLRRAGSRRMMREPSVVVRDTAVEHIEERQSDWAYSKPVVVLDLLWNLMFVAVAAALFVSSREEKPYMPLRVWIAGYVLQCIVHMVCVWLEYKRRVMVRDGAASEDQEGDDKLSFAKHLESANTMFSFIWWIIGFYWISAGGQTLSNQAPQLYWLCIVFLAFDVFFVVFCVALACLVGIAVCCCLPCIIAILYAVRDQEGASEKDISELPKFKFRRTDFSEKVDAETGESIRGGIMTQCDTDPPVEQPLQAEDAMTDTVEALNILATTVIIPVQECCICLCGYEDGVELRELPCGHHFHCDCIDKWLHINATCPLCKYSIKKTDSYGDEVV